MQTTSCLIVTIMVMVFLLVVYALAWCWAIRAEERHISRETLRKYFRQ